MAYLRSLELNVLLICEFGVILHKLSLVKLEIQNMHMLGIRFSDEGARLFGVDCCGSVNRSEVT